MKTQITARLEELQVEYKKGQDQLATLEQETSRQRLSQSERLVRLNKAAIIQMQYILTSPSLGKFPSADK